MNTADRPGAPFNGLGPGSWEQGVYDYRALPLPNTYAFTDKEAVASWSYDYNKKELISFDSEEVGHRKGEWIKQEGLRGSMFWELSGDKGTKREGMEGGEGKIEVPGRSLIEVVKNAMGPLDQSPNWLQYEGSQFDNMKKGMPTTRSSVHQRLASCILAKTSTKIMQNIGMTYVTQLASQSNETKDFNEETSIAC